jgi:hypothetical protein
VLAREKLPNSRRLFEERPPFARVEENCAADDVVLTPDQISKLNAVTPAAGDHHSEQQMQMIER